MLGFLKRKSSGKLDPEEIIKANFTPEQIEAIKNSDQIYSAVNESIKAGIEITTGFYANEADKCKHPKEDCPIKKIVNECRECKNQSCMEEIK